MLRQSADLNLVGLKRLKQVLVLSRLWVALLMGAILVRFQLAENEILQGTRQEWRDREGMDGKGLGRIGQING